MRKEIYLAIIRRIKDAELGVLHFDLWNENIQFIVRKKPFRIPAVFVEFEPVKWKQAGARVKSGDFNIRLHIITRTMGETADGSKYQLSELEALALVEKITAVIPGLCGDGFNAFVHTDTIPDNNHDELVENIECFKTRVTDVSAAKCLNLIKGTAEPVIKKRVI